MSRLNTMYPNDEFLKDISNVIGKVDSKNETQIKKEIEQVGYKEFYRYYKEKDIYIKQLKQENQKLKIQISAREEVANKYKEVIDKAINDLDIIIDIVREQPFGDRWIINRLEANKNILKEVE